MLSIKSSLMSENAARTLNKSAKSVGRSLERLSSGLRINGASDDAAGLSVSTRMNTQIREATQLIKNVNDTASLVQTASGLLREQINSLQRMRELTVQALNDTQQRSDLESIQAEISHLKEEITDISEGTFNEKTIFGNQFSFELDGAENLANLTVKTQKSSSDRLGRHVLKTSQVGVNQEAFEAGDLTLSTLDGGTVSLRASLANDDQLSTSNNASSAISKAAAINDQSEFTGVDALVGETTFTGGAEIQAVTLDHLNYFKINGVAISGIEVDVADASGTLVDAINANASETGVVANITDDGELKLVAADGRNIEINTVGNATQVGLGQSVTSAQLTLRSSNGFNVSYADLTVDEKIGLMFDTRIDLFAGHASRILAGPDAGVTGFAFLGEPSATNYNIDNVTLSGRYNGANTAGDHNFDLEIDLPNSGLYFGVLDNDPDGNGNYTPTEYHFINDINIVSEGYGTYYFTTTAGATELAALGITNDPASRVFVRSSLDASYGDSYFQFKLVNANTVDAFDVGLDPNNPGDPDGVDAFRFVAPIGDLNSLDHFVGVGFDHQVDTIDVTDKDGAERALWTIDKSISELSEAESLYGSIINRLDSAERSLEQERVSLSRAKSQIMDADFADESSGLAQSQITQQAGVSILAQANTQNSIALQLLS
jgi:flagellin